MESKDFGRYNQDIWSKVEFNFEKEPDRYRIEDWHKNYAGSCMRQILMANKYDSGSWCCKIPVEILRIILQMSVHKQTVNLWRGAYAWECEWCHKLYNVGRYGLTICKDCRKCTTPSFIYHPRCYQTHCWACCLYVYVYSHLCKGCNSVKIHPDFQYCNNCK